ncbi:MAG: hypothetical protein WCV90_06965 [Candidatus Woesearchaeota archaeon]|jgi:hypothetical protein
MKTTNILGILFLLVIPLSFALDCNTIQNKQYCLDIQNSNLSALEKNYLLGDILSDKKQYPDHALISDWNSKITGTSLTFDIASTSNGVIQNAWIKVLSVMPSVLSNDTLLISPNGKILTGYNYEIKLPSGTASGDCKTEYSLSQNTASSQIFLNGNLLGSSHLLSYSTNQDGSITANYNIKVVTKIVHYKWKRPCKSCSKKCLYDRTDYQTDQLSLSDNLPVMLYNPPLWADFNIKDQYWNTTKANFTYGDFANLELSFNDSYFKSHNYVFSQIFGTGGVLVLKAEEKRDTEVNNLDISEGNIFVSNLNNCSINISDFFKSKNIPCNLNFTKFDFSANTDKTSYQEGEDITLTISPVGNYQVKYANHSYVTDGHLALKAVYPYNRITVVHDGNYIEKYIHVENTQPIGMFASLTTFGILNYALVGFVRKFWGVVV